MEYTYNVSQRKSKSKSKIRNDKKRQNIGHLRPVPNVSRKEKIMRMSDIIEDFKRKFGINSDEIMVVGDTNTDMQFAKNGGALAVGVLSGVGEKEELKESADFIIADVGQLMYNWKNIEIQESRQLQLWQNC